MRARTLLELGRVSNLPTVVSNVLCGAALAGESARALPLALTVTAGVLFYVGGMFLNDGFDAAIDAKERPERPIPSGRARRETVLGIGFGLLGAGLALLAVGSGFTPAGVALLLVGALTAGAVVVYDRFHKGFALSPVVMGLCRAGLYLMGAFAVAAEPDYGVFVAAFTLLLYIVGLTHIARFENATAIGRAWPTVFVFAPLVLALAQPIARVHAGRPLLALAVVSALWSLRSLRLARAGGRNIGRAVVTLIAGISLLDAVFAASREAFALAVLALACFAVTLFGQRAIRGT